MELKGLKAFAGFGIAGNVANHLAQAGELEDFRSIETVEANAPKGIFAFYSPVALQEPMGFLSTFPLSTTTLHLREDSPHTQIEPEIALICEMTYADEKVKSICPVYFAAYNDCSLRIKDAPKISYKKNWGEASKGISGDFLSIDRFDDVGILHDYRLVSYPKREGQWHLYGEDTLVSHYTYFDAKLLDWIIYTLNNQQDMGPLQGLLDILRVNAYPSHIIISIGATCYSDFGKSHFLERGDEIAVVAYPYNTYHLQDVVACLDGNATLERCSILRQVCH